MAYDAAGFRAAFPEFARKDDYPDVWISPLLLISTQLVSEERWADLYDYGRYLQVAHRLVHRKRQADTAEAGGTPGQASGMLSAKSLDKGSMTFDTASTAEEGAGWWNTTTYGQEYWRLAMMFGAGGVQL